MGKPGIVIILGLISIVLVTSLIYKEAGYKVCPNCSADTYFQRGLSYACHSDKDHRITALNFIKKAAEKGKFQARLLLAELYLEKFPKGYKPIYSKQVECLSNEIKPDKKTATLYFKQVITDLKKEESVPPELFFNLYLLYANGILSADKPKEEAERWLVKAAETGNHSAMVLLAEAADARGDFGLAKKWFEKAACDPVDWKSALAVGDYYFYGKGTGIDYVQAQKWYEKSLQAAKKLASTIESREERETIEAAPRVRLDIVRKRLAQYKKEKKGVLEYRLEGGLNQYLVYVKGISKDFELAGRVMHKDGKIMASLNSKLKFATPPKAMEKADFKSMVEGVKWLLQEYAGHMTKDGAVSDYEFLLSKS